MASRAHARRLRALRFRHLTVRVSLRHPLHGHAARAANAWARQVQAIMNRPEVVSEIERRTRERMHNLLVYGDTRGVT